MIYFHGSIGRDKCTDDNEFLQYCSRCHVARQQSHTQGKRGVMPWSAPTCEGATAHAWVADVEEN
jgi:hypothetical protein